MDSFSSSRHRTQGFDFTGHMRRLCADMVGRVSELGHIDLDRVAISFTQARNAYGHGTQATTTPMRFEDGALVTRRRGRQYTVERLYDSGGRELLYIVSFYLPRFQNHSLREKVATVIHELWHISPKFDGDLRRFDGRCFAHGGSQKEYDVQVDAIAESWWSRNPPPETYAFLKSSFRELEATYGDVYGAKVRHPKLIPIS